MSQFLSSYELLFVPFTAAAAVQIPLRPLSMNAPLQTLVLKWLTKHDQEATLQNQYVLIRNSIAGSSIFGVRRNLLLGAIFSAIAVALFAATFIEPSQSKNIPMLVIGTYAFWYFHFWSVVPISCLLLLLAAYAACHIAFYVFDFITLKTWKFGNSLVAYCLLLGAGYLVCFMLTTLIGIGAASLIAQTTEKGFFESLVETVLRVPKIIEDMDDIFTKPLSEDDDGFAGVIMLAYFIGVAGTMSICFFAILLLSITNLVYGAAIGTLRIDAFLREKYKYNQTRILNDPVGYSANILSVLTFIVASMLCFTFGLLA